jgi:hypothetical protein
MDYIRQLNAFSNLSAGMLSSNEVNVYLRLFWWNNRCCWTEWFETTDSRLQIETGICSRNTLRDIRNSLRQKGFIDFIPGKKRKPTQYKIIDLSERSDVDSLPLWSISDHNADHKGDHNADHKGDHNADHKDDHINKHKRKTETETKKEKQKEKAGIFLLEDYTDNAELLEALRGFVEMRKKIKAPLTEHAFSLLLKKLDGMGSTDEEKAAIVNQSVMNSWKGLFPLKQEVRRSGAHISHSKDALDERYPDFAEANRNYVPPWEVRPAGGGDRAASG